MLDLRQVDLAKLTGISAKQINAYWNGSRSPGADYLFPLARVLKCDAEWLGTGVGRPKPATLLVDVDDAEWAMFPRYDVRSFTETSKGEPIEHYPIRLDWLNRHARSSKGLWITEMPTHYMGAEAPDEGDTIICRDVEHREGLGLFLYLYDGAPMVRKFVLPDPDPRDSAKKWLWDVSDPLSDPPGMRVVAKVLGSIKLQVA